MRDTEIVREMLEAWKDNDPTRRQMAEDIEWVMPHPGLTSSGREEMGPAMMDFRNTWDVYEFDVDDVLPLDDGRVLALFTEHVKGAASGIEQTVHAGAICTLADGKIVRFEAYIRSEDALRAAGLPLDAQSHS